MKKHVVRLSSSEREELFRKVKENKIAAYKRLHAQILLKADVGADGPGWKDKNIADAFDVTVQTVERVRERLCSRGFENALSRKNGGGGRKRKLDGVQEAQLVAMSCSKSPAGTARWTLRLLADQMVELRYVDDISYESVRRTLKKTK